MFESIVTRNGTETCEKRYFITSVTDVRGFADRVLSLRKSVFAIFIGLGAEITGKILKKHLTFSKNIIEMIRLSYNFSKTEIRGVRADEVAAGKLEPDGRLTGPALVRCPPVCYNPPNFKRRLHDAA